MSLTLDVRIDGFTDPVGKLTRNDAGGHAFAYLEAYLELRRALPLSLSMPLRLGPCQDSITRAFFGNLLAERDTMLRTVMEREGIDRDDIAGLLMHLGKDCPGAISVLPEGDPPIKVPGDFTTDYIPLSDQRMAEIEHFLSRMGLIRRAARDRTKKRDLTAMSHYFDLQLKEMDERGLRTFADLIASNMRTLLPAIGIEVPEGALERDAAIARGGG